MQLDELIAKVSRLPALRQQEVMDFVMFLEQRDGKAEQADWSEQHFRTMSIEQAMRCTLHWPATTALAIF